VRSMTYAVDRRHRGPALARSEGVALRPSRLAGRVFHTHAEDGVIV